MRMYWTHPEKLKRHNKNKKEINEWNPQGTRRRGAQERGGKREYKRNSDCRKDLGQSGHSMSEDKYGNLE